MLAKLIEQRIEVVRKRKDNQFGVLATRSKSDEISFIAYNYEEDENDLDIQDELEITLKDLKAYSNYKIVETSIDKSNNNTYAAWQKLGSPANSKNVDLSELQKAAELSPTSDYKFKTNKNGEAKIILNLMRHSMKLIEITK